MSQSQNLPIIVANWKLNGGLDLICTSVAAFIGRHLDAEIYICPPNIYLRDMMDFLTYSQLKIGAQNVSRYESGAYTGETSAQMLAEAGCKLCLIGHSERRAMFGETNEGCRLKVTTALNHGLLPVLCVGETKEERANGQTQHVIESQLRQGLAKIDLSGRDLLVAYEPVWAIGTGLAASPEDAAYVHRFIRETLADMAGAQTAGQIKILYGGSVKKANAGELLAKENIDGLLVGGASLDPGHFVAICEAASKLASDRAANDRLSVEDFADGAC